MHASDIASALGTDETNVKVVAERLHRSGQLSRTGNYRYYSSEEEKEASLEKKAFNPLARLFGVGAAGAGVGYAEADWLGMEDRQKHINALLNAVTFAAGGSKYIGKGRGTKNVNILRPGGAAPAAALSWPIKTMGLAYTDTAQKEMLQAEALQDKALAAAQAELAAANKGVDAATAMREAAGDTAWNDVKDWASKNKGLATTGSIAAGGLGTALLGSLIYRNLKGNETGNTDVVLEGNPDTVSLELPKEKLSDSFYRSLSRDLLFKDKELNAERNEADVEKRKQKARQKRLATKATE